MRLKCVLWKQHHWRWYLVFTIYYLLSESGSQNALGRVCLRWITAWRFLCAQ